LTRGVVLRGIGFAAAVVLGAVAVWLVVTSDTQKRLELGVLAGLWAALVGAYAMFGARRGVHPLDGDYIAEPGPSTDVALRVDNMELERAEEAAARRAHETRLENMLRREIQTSVAREVGGLRAEIAQLRGDLLEKVGGQLRLERIETTRVIGSDLEALQHELRQLKAAAQDTGDFRAGAAARAPDPAPVRQIVEPARVRPVSRQTAEVEADVQPARTRPDVGSPRAVVTVEPQSAAPASPTQSGPSPIPADATAPIRLAAIEALAAAAAAGPASAPAAAPPPQAAPSTQPPAEPDPPTPRPAPPAAAAPAPEPRPQPPPPAPAFAADDFASLPRIRPFTEFELDPIEDEPSYTGRRRRIEDEANGRHARPAETDPQRHRRPEERTDDLLARLLARDS
jgi:hypothetical protein